MAQTIDIQAAMDKVCEHVEANQRFLTAFAVPMAEMAGAIKQLDRCMIQQFAQVDRRFDEVDQRFDRVEQRLDQVDQRLDQVDRRLDQVDQRFVHLEKTMETRFGLVDDRLRKLDARMEQLVGYIIQDEQGKASSG